MMQDWKSYHTALMGQVGEFGKQTPDTMRSLMAMDGAAAKTGHLEPKVHELIALAVSVTTRCDGCIATHTKRAIEHGASQAEVAEALSVAISLNAGAAVTYSARVMEAYEQFAPK